MANAKQAPDLKDKARESEESETFFKKIASFFGIERAPPASPSTEEENGESYNKIQGLLKLHESSDRVLKREVSSKGLEFGIPPTPPKVNTTNEIIPNTIEVEIAPVVHEDEDENEGTTKSPGSPH